VSISSFGIWCGTVGVMIGYSLGKLGMHSYEAGYWIGAAAGGVILAITVALLRRFTRTPS
jgi:hypothetical protein